MDAGEAATQLGVKRQTLYAYASRGKIRTAPVAGSRSRRYLRSDVARVCARRDARSGHGAVAAGALRWGEPVLDSALTRIDPAGHAYRDRPALSLAGAGTSFEAVAEFLWTGVLPDDRPSWGANGGALRLGVDARKLSALLSAGARPIDGPTLALPALALADEQRFGTAEASLEVERARKILRRLCACLALGQGAARVQGALEAGSTAASFLVALGGRTTARAVAAVERALILCADHELNPSSFAARVAASAGADLYACLGAALATLSGPVHGGACDRVEAWVDQVDRPGRAAAAVRERIRTADRLPGFRHRLYPEGDPRAPALLADAERLAPRSRPVRTIRSLVDAMALAGGGRPTLDTGLVALAGALRLPPGSAHALFAVGRSAGWVAHVLEQRQAGYLLRPRARFVPER